MQLDRAIITLVPRSMSHCMDLGVLFVGRHLLTILKLWLVYVAVFGGLLWWGMTFWNWDFRYTCLFAYTITLPMGVMLIRGAAPALFGQPFTLRQMLRIDREGLGLVFSGLFIRGAMIAGPVVCYFIAEEWWVMLLAVLLWFWPGLWLAVRNSFVIEQLYLEELETYETLEHTTALIRHETADLYGRLGWIQTFFSLLVIMTFVTLDLSADWLFDFEILLTRTIRADSALTGQEMFQLAMEILWHNPVTNVTLLAVMLLIYPMTRIAWLFCYLDLKVRRDLWDLELQFAQEARRLETN